MPVLSKTRQRLLSSRFLRTWEATVLTRLCSMKSTFVFSTWLSLIWEFLAVCWTSDKKKFKQWTSGRSVWVLAKDVMLVHVLLSPHVPPFIGTCLSLLNPWHVQVLQQKGLSCNFAIFLTHTHTPFLSFPCRPTNPRDSSPMIHPPLGW